VITLYYLYEEQNTATCREQASGLQRYDLHLDMTILYNPDMNCLYSAEL